MPKLRNTIIITVFALDRLTKWLAAAWIAPEAPQAVLPWVNFVMVHNTGAAFGLLAQAGGWQRWLLSGVAVAVCVFLWRWSRQFGRGDAAACVGVALVIGGALGNLFDRLLHGRVPDFVDVHYAGYHWPAFNVADAAITIGALALIAATLTTGEVKHGDTAR